MRVFLDSRSLSATPKLWSTIRTALQDSEYFLLLASPGSASSEWVPREVEHWLGLGRADKLLVALTDGVAVPRHDELRRRPAIVGEMVHVRAPRSDETPPPYGCIRRRVQPRRSIPRDGE